MPLPASLNTRNREVAPKSDRLLGAKIAEPLMIEEEATQNNDSRSVVNNVRMSRVAADSGNSGPSLSVGTIPIRMRIKTVFRLAE